MSIFSGVNNPGLDFQPFTAGEIALLMELATIPVTAGELIYANGTAWAGLGIGAPGQVLTVSGGLPTWQTISGTGSVTSVSVVSANGFAGTVANASTTPAITLTTSVTGTLYGNGTAISAGKLALTQPATGSTLTIADGKTLTVSKTMTLTAADDTGVYTFPTGTNTLVPTTVATLSSLTSIGTITTGGLGTGAVIGGVTMTLGSDAAYDLHYRGATGVLTRLGMGTTGQFLAANTGAAPTWGTPSGSGTVTSVSVTTANGVSGSVATATTTPAITLTLGAITPSSVNGNTITTGTGTLTLGAGKTLTVSNTMTFAAGADSQTWTFPSSSDTVVTLGATQTLTAKTLTTPVINGTITGTGQATAATASTIVMRDSSANTNVNNTNEGYTTTVTAGTTTTLTVASPYQQFFTGSTTQTLVMPVTSTLALGTSYYIVNLSTGAVAIQSSGTNNIVTIGGGSSCIITCILTSGTTAASWSANVFNVGATSGKVVVFDNSLTFTGTDATTMTLPATSATLGGLGIAQTWTGANTFNNIIDANNAITASGNAATVPVTYRVNTVTNNSAATLTITLTTSGAANRQMVMVCILDSSAAAQTITWVNTENSTVTAPTTSNGSTTLPLTVGFQYNAGTSKWRCIASA